MRANRGFLLLVLLTVLLAACPPRQDGKPAPPSPAPGDPVFKIHFFGDKSDPVTAGMLRGAELAASTLAAGTLGRPVVIEDRGPADPISLAALVDDADAVGVVIAGSAAVLDQIEPAFEPGRLPVVSLTEDIYEAGRMRPWTLAGSIPHGWQSWRLARYFGPGDRGYRSVGLIATQDADGDSARRTLSHELARRGVTFVDPGPLTEPSWSELPEKISSLRKRGVDAVVLEGPRSLLEATISSLRAPEQVYKGRTSIGDGWRPQIAGFSSLMQSGLSPPAGSVSANDFTWATRSGIERVEAFIQSYEQRFEEPPVGFESRAYDAVRSLVEAFRRAEMDRDRTITQLETFDRVTFARTQISFAQTDHVLPERDVLGLWAVTKDGAWSILHRSFTNDLERTNIHEEDWQVFFPKAVPGGEAPFFKDAIWGITSERTDDLH